MFSALRSMVAGAAVALCSSVLLAGILTTQPGTQSLTVAVILSPSPITTAEFLSGMATEEVEPGVLRVVNDGYRDLTAPSGSMWPLGSAGPAYTYPGLRAVIVGDAGSVWRTAECVSPAPESHCVRLYRVGQEQAWDIDPVPVSFWTDQIDAGPDGRLWALANGAPRVFEDGAWVPDAHGIEGDFGALAVQDDGTVWLVGQELCWTGEASAGCTDWSDAYDDGGVITNGGGITRSNAWTVTGDGVVWFMADTDADGPAPFLRFDGTEWQVVAPPADFPGDPQSLHHSVGIAPDGSTYGGTWWTAGDPFVQHQSLTRLDAEGWTTFTAADGVGTWGGQEGEWDLPTDMLMVAPDGSAWVNATIATGTGTTRTTGRGVRTCDGVARFDGVSWQPFLAGYCISDLDFAPDGSAWVVALDPAGRELGTYVITPPDAAVAG